MRDPQRIERVLADLRIHWHLHSELRLGQLVSNLARDSDVFYVEDDVLERRLRAAVEAKTNT